MKVNYGRLFVELLMAMVIPLAMLLMGVGTYFKVKNLEFEWIELSQEADTHLGEYTWEAAVVNYILEVEYEMKINQEWNTLAISYIFLGIMEGTILAFMFKKFNDGRYIEVL